MIHDKLEKESISSLTITHLEILITKFTKLNHEVTIGTDANVAFKSNAGDIARLCKKCQLIDPISTKYRTKGEPNTYTRGLGQIYYFFCTRIIYKFIKKCGILPFLSIVTFDPLTRPVPATPVRDKGSMPARGWLVTKGVYMLLE